MFAQRVKRKNMERKKANHSFYHRFAPYLKKIRLGRLKWIEKKKRKH